jgi:hypothetical protein
MLKLHPTRIRIGALALGIAALLLTAFPLIRPFFPFDPRSPVETLTVASPALISAPWVLAHFLAMLAFVLLLGGVLILYAALANGREERRAFRALVFSLAGIALIMPTLGVEVYTLPVIGKVYLEGKTDIASVVSRLYLGPATVVLLAGLVLLAIGALHFAVAIWQSGVLPRWAGVAFALGLALWLPLFPPVIRIVDGLVIGLGGVWLAASLWPKTECTQQK